MTNKELNRSSQEILNHLRLNYKLAILKTEMDIHTARSTRANTKLSRYFNSTPIRFSFARWMSYCGYVNRFYTISELVKQMLVTRQSISQVITECEAEGWINVVRDGKSTKCQASHLLLERMDEYIGWRKELAKDSIGQAFLALNSFEKLLSNEFPLNTDNE